MFHSVSRFYIPASNWIWKVMKELAGFPPPRKEELVMCRVAADLILFPTHPLAVTSSLTGDESCVVAAEIGFCSGHPCPWSKSKVPNIDAANSSTCSQNARVLEEDFLGELASRREALMELWSLVTTVLFGGGPQQSPSCLFMIVFCSFNAPSL